MIRSNLIVLFFVVAILGTGYHLYLTQGRVFRDFGSKGYGLLAVSVVDHHRLSGDGETPTASRPPLYPLLLAAVYLLSGDLQAAGTVQSILAGAMLGIAAVISTLYTRQYWLSGAILLLYASMADIPKENITQRDTLLFTFFLIMGCFVFINLERKYRWDKVVWLGLMLGAASLVRPLAIIGLLFALSWGWYLKSESLPWRTIGWRVSLFLATFYLALLPWGIYNLLTLNYFTITSTTDGFNLWKGNNPGTAEFYPFADVDELEDLLQEPPAESGWWDDLRAVEGMNEVERNDYLRRLGLDYIYRHPGQFLTMGLLKVYTLWLPQMTPLGQGDMVWTKVGARIDDFEAHRYPILPYLLSYLLIGVGCWKIRGSAYYWYLLTWFVSLSLLHFVFFGESRFRYPVNILALPMAAVGFSVLVVERHWLVELFQAKSETDKEWWRPLVPGGQLTGDSGLREDAALPTGPGAAS